MTEKTKTNVLIDGRNFTVVGNGPEEYIHKLAVYVDKKIKEMVSKNSRLSSSMAATLAALNIADELYKALDELKSLKNRAKSPMENYENLLNQLKEMQTKNEQLSMESNMYKDELLNIKKENERLKKELENYIQAMELKEKELQDSQNTIKKLQDKIFDSQMQIIEIKKELEEAVKLYDKEKNIFSKEEI
ncbi:cell division protein ZapA [Tepidimicrobium xylanilyticum]|uniref:Cell division protein ZapA n=1 Tax=Tepidimicrobium xylanilyticum TaxID=1123352 RepID=A0A1H3BGV3_9FIRM|nr:cell division protein ZapA [Tepidimicrobium xylanilyticum]GMG96905.1 cell division protein ZapA [Tepidimicrobium xylanilyticum]SDX41136.1 cell division protein ZapA [Tepidimicrobium xylanilyticum]